MFNLDIVLVVLAIYIIISIAKVFVTMGKGINKLMGTNIKDWTILDLFNVLIYIPYIILILVYHTISKIMYFKPFRYNTSLQNDDKCNRVSIMLNDLYLDKIIIGWIQFKKHEQSDSEIMFVDITGCDNINDAEATLVHYFKYYNDIIIVDHGIVDPNKHRDSIPRI